MNVTFFDLEYERVQKVRDFIKFLEKIGFPSVTKEEFDRLICINDSLIVMDSPHFKEVLFVNKKKICNYLYDGFLYINEFSDFDKFKKNKFRRMIYGI